MPILTEAELSVYAPDVTLTGVILAAKLAAIQAILEGPKGAQRSLELTEYNEIKDVRKRLQTCQLSYWPIVDDPLPVIQIRTGNVLTRYNSPVALGEWVEIDNPLDFLDHTGQVNLSRASGGFRLGTGEATQINAVYTSGLDFSVGTTDPDAIQIKQLAAAILDFQENDITALGVSSYSADHEGKFTIRAPSSGGSVGGGSVPNVGDSSDFISSMLLLVHKYRPRGVI